MEVDRPVTALVEAAAALVDASAEVEAIEDENELDSTAAAAKAAEVDTGVSVEDEPMVGYTVWLNVADAVVLSMEELTEDDGTSCAATALICGSEGTKTRVTS